MNRPVLLLAVTWACLVAWTHTASAVEIINDPSEIRHESHVEGISTDMGGGVWHYEYTVYNDDPEYLLLEEMPVSPGIIAYLLPLPPDVDNTMVWGIEAPEPGETYQWDYDIFTPEEYETWYGQPSPFGPGDHMILEWFDLFPPEGGPEQLPIGTQEGWDNGSDWPPYMPHPFYSAGIPDPYFEFMSTIPPTDGPYATRWVDQFTNIGDPPIPGELGGVAPFNPNAEVIPEPATIGLLGFGLLDVLRRRRRR